MIQSCVITLFFSCSTGIQSQDAKVAFLIAFKAAICLFLFIARPLGNQISEGAPPRKNYDGCFGGSLPHD